MQKNNFLNTNIKLGHSQKSGCGSHSGIFDARCCSYKIKGKTPELTRVRLALSGSSTHAVAVIKQGNSLFNKQQTARVEDAEINSAITLFDKRQMAHGFTLIELLVVVLIIGILAAVALPQYQIAVAKSRVANAWPTLSTIAQANKAACLANPTTGSANDLIDYPTSSDWNFNSSSCATLTAYPNMDFSIATATSKREILGATINLNSTRQNKKYCCAYKYIQGNYTNIADACKKLGASTTSVPLGILHPVSLPITCYEFK